MRIGKRRTNSGFVVTNAIIGLWINSLTLILLFSLSRSMTFVPSRIYDSHLLDEHWFIIHLEEYIEHYELISINQSNIVFADEQNERVIYFERYYNKDGLMIRRRTNQGGHEVLLNRLTSMRFEDQGDSLIVKLQHESASQSNVYKISLL